MHKEAFESLRHIAGDTAYGLGIESYRNYAVLDTSIGIRSISARVANERGRFEWVQLRWPNRQLEAECSCDWHQTPFCRHTVAVILEARHKYSQIDEALISRWKANRGYFYSSTSASSSDLSENATQENSPTSPGKQAPAPASKSLRNLLLQYSSEAALSLHLQGEAPFLDTKWQQTELTVSLHYNSRAYAGSNLKTLVETGHGSGGMRFRQFSSQEQQAMRYLLASSQTANTSNFSLTAYEIADLFHILTDFPRIFCTSGRLIINRAVLEPVLLISKEDDHYRLVPRFNKPQQGLMPSQDLRPVVGRGGTWLASGGVYWWVPGFTDIEWLRAFIRGKPFHFTNTELDKLRAEQEKQTLPFRFYPADQIKELSVTTPECVPVISLDWETDGIAAEIDFQYGSQRIPPRAPAVIWHETGFIRRDFSQEQEAVNEVKKAGFKDQQAAGQSVTFKINKPNKIWRFINNLDRKLKNRWRVFYTDRFDKVRNNSGTMELTIKTADESGSWFELMINPLTPAGEILELRKVFTAIENDKDFLKLSDGGVLKLPEELKLALISLKGRAIKVNEQENILRFGHYAAFPVNAILKKYTNFHEHEHSESDWRRFCRRLEQSLTTDTVAIPDSLQDILRDYQKSGVVWLKRLNDCGFHGILADEMGLGKTVQALALILSNAESPSNAKRPSLVVCPTSLTENWLHEAAHFTPQLRCTLITGAERREKINNIEQFDLAITSYALLRRDIDYYKELNFEYLILDEAQHIKNPHTANAKTSKAVSARYRCILTGTPLENNLWELWSLFDFLMPGMLGTKAFFRRHYEKRSDDQTVNDELLQQIKPFIMRRTKEQVCQELPPKQEQVLYCDLYPAQRRLYDSLLADNQELLAELQPASWSQNRFQYLTLLMRLRQVCDLPALLPPELQPDQEHPLPSAKMDLLREIVYEGFDSGRRILLFSQFTKVLQHIAAWLDNQEISYEYLDGATTNRLERVDRFNSDASIPLFLISLRAGGTGLNLTGADTVIHYDQWWNPMVEDQATDRSHRIGQDKTVTVMKFAARDTIEEKIIQLQEHKRELFQEIMSGSYSGAGELTAEDFKFLLE
ncbi:MAG: SNF2-related protein, partial [Verrucomicrobiota bacterium]